MSIKELRIKNKLTQAQASKLTGIPLRTYKVYENDPEKEGNIKYRYIESVLNEYGFVDETHGILPLEEIKENVAAILSKYPVEYAVLFGSYAKGTATQTSDIDLLISTEITGMKFFGIAEELRNILRKKVDLLDLKQLNNNPELTNNVLKEGIRIYVQE